MSQKMHQFFHFNFLVKITFFSKKLDMLMEKKCNKNRTWNLDSQSWAESLKFCFITFWKYKMLGFDIEMWPIYFWVFNVFKWVSGDV